MKRAKGKGAPSSMFSSHQQYFYTHAPRSQKGGKSSAIICLDSWSGGFFAEGRHTEPQPGGKRENRGCVQVSCILGRQQAGLVPSCESDTDQEAGGEDGIREVGQPWPGRHP